MAYQLSPAGSLGPSVKAGVTRWILVNGSFLLALAFVLFLSAGRVDWGVGWTFILIMTACQLILPLVLMKNRLELLVERSWMQKGSKTWDIQLVGVISVGWIAMLLTAGLSMRFGWKPPVPAGFPVIGLILVVLGNGLFLWAMSSNRFFSTFIRIQADRGHAVASQGPYRFVRHPGYLGAMLVFTGTPWMLATWWAFVPVILFLCLYIYRTAREDHTLIKELDGYADYARRIRYRLIPGVW